MIVGQLMYDNQESFVTIFDHKPIAIAYILNNHLQHAVSKQNKVHTHQPFWSLCSWTQDG